MEHRTDDAMWKISHTSDELGYVEEFVPAAKLDARLSELRGTLTTRRVMAEPISADAQWRSPLGI